MQIKELSNREEILQSFAVLIQIYPNLNEETYIEDVLNMMQRGYKMAGVFESEENGAMHEMRAIGVVGVRVIRKLSFGKILEIEDFMIDRARRGIGVGKMLIKWVEYQAAVFGCKMIIGDLDSKRLESHKIYSREKFILEGFHFRKNCD